MVADVDVVHGFDSLHIVAPYTNLGHDQKLAALARTAEKPRPFWSALRVVG